MLASMPGTSIALLAPPTALVTLLLVGTTASATPSLPGAAPAQSPPTVSAYADLDLRWNAGTLTLEHLTLGRFPTPVQLRHYVGRFAAEVRGHGAVLETLRFDFPLLGDADAGVEEKLAETMRAKLTTMTVVRVPLPEGAETIRIRDRRAGSDAPPALEVPLSGASRPSGPSARTAEPSQAKEPPRAKEPARVRAGSAPRK